MEERIQLNIQLPLEELGRFSRLVDQLQQMMAAAETGGGGKQEAEDSPAFDLARFQALMQAENRSQDREFPAAESREQVLETEISVLSDLPSPQADISPVAETPTAQAAVSPLPDAPAAQSEISPLMEAPSAQGDVSPLPDAPTAGSDFSSLPEVPAAQIEEALQNTDIPTAAPDRDTSSPDLPVQVPENPQEEREFPSPPDNTPQAQVLQELAAPVAGYYPEVQLPDPPGGAWNGVREELTYAGPAPLTAEAVSLAFQRDDRRYDNGFPLY